MMTLKISVFRTLFFISSSINRNVLCFIQMSSSDDEAQSPDIGASGPKDSPPPLQSESADVEDQLPMTKMKKGHRRPRIAIMREDAIMAEDATKLQIHIVFNLGNYMHHICFV